MKTITKKEKKTIVLKNDSFLKEIFFIKKKYI